MSDALLPLIAFEESLFAPPGNPLIAEHPSDIQRAVDFLKRSGYAVHEFVPQFEGKILAFELTFQSRIPDREVTVYFSFGDDHTEFTASFPQTPVAGHRKRYEFQVYLDREDTDFDAFIRKVTTPTFMGFLFGQSLNKAQRYALSRITKTEPAYPKLRDAFNSVVKIISEVPEVETMHTMTGYDEAFSGPPQFAGPPPFSDENRTLAERWAKQEFPKEFREKPELWYEFVFDWSGAFTTSARAILYFARREVDLVLANSNAGCDYEEAPDRFEDYLHKINLTIHVETHTPPEIRKKLERAYEGFLARLRPPPEIETMHTVTGYDEARRERYPTTDFSAITNVEWRALGSRAATADPRVVFAEASGRITYNRGEGDPGFNITLTPLPVNAPQIHEIRVEMEVDEPPKYLHEETIVLPDRFPLTYEGITGDARLAAGAGLWPEIVRLFMSARAPEPEEMHTMTGYDEGLRGMIGYDQYLLQEAVPVEFTRDPAEGAAIVDPRDFEATFEWAKATLPSPTLRVSGFSGTPNTLSIKIPSTIVPEVWIAMTWIVRRSFSRFELEIPHGRSSSVYNFIVRPEYGTFDAALNKMAEGLVRPVAINALKKFRKKETNIGKLSQLYNEIHQRLFAAPPEMETMHTMTGYDEALQEQKLDYHEELNPILYDGDRLKPEVREKLLEFGRAFAEFAKIPEIAILDVYLTGGNANYNYTPYSDLDVHVIIDRDAFAKELKISREWLDDYFVDKKTIWTLKHDIKVKGIGLEPYAEDVNMPHPEGMGVYSLENDRWVSRPKLDLTVRNILTSPAFTAKFNATRELIDNLLTTEAPIEEFEKFKEKLRDMRRAGLMKGGEFSLENLVFKGLRNEGYLERVSDYVSGKLDVGLSLESKARSVRFEAIESVFQLDRVPVKAKAGYYVASHADFKVTRWPKEEAYALQLGIAYGGVGASSKTYIFANGVIYDRVPNKLTYRRIGSTEPDTVLAAISETSPRELWLKMLDYRIGSTGIRHDPGKAKKVSALLKNVRVYLAANFPAQVERFTEATFRVVEPEEMHTMTGYDEAAAVTAGSTDLWDATLAEMEAAKARWAGSRKGREAIIHDTPNTEVYPGGWSYVVFYDRGATNIRADKRTLEIHFYVRGKEVLLGTFIKGEWKTVNFKYPRLLNRLPPLRYLPKEFAPFPEMYREVLALFELVEPEEMHTMTGYDEGVRGNVGPGPCPKGPEGVKFSEMRVIIGDDENLLKNSVVGESLTIRAYGHGRDPLRLNEREFRAALAWTEGAGLDTMNAAEYHRILVSFDSYQYPLRPGEAVPGIVMRWIGNYTTREGDLAFTLDIPRGRGLKTYAELRELTERERTLPEALKTISAYADRPVDKAALRKLPKEGAWPRMCEVYQHIYDLLTAAPLEPEEMHTMTGYDEARQLQEKQFYTHQQMLDAGADGFLQRARLMYIPIDKIEGREPVPAASEGEPYVKGKKITQPIEVEYDKDSDRYVVYAGNHRIRQAEVNGDKSILAFVQR